VEHVLLEMVQKIMDLDVLPSLQIATTILQALISRCPKVGLNTFALMIIYLDESWIPWHVV
jgi:hypothetical protein